MKKNILKILLPVLLLAVFLTGFALGRDSWQLPSEKNLQNTELSKPPGADFSLFWDVWNLIEAKFVNRDELNRQKMIYGAISGLVNSLSDPYSVFLTPDESANFKDELEGHFEGIGVEIGVQAGVLTVIAPLEGTPAKQAGLQAGDQILEVDGQATNDLSLDEAVAKIKGPKGTEVNLTILKKDQTETRQVKIVRDVIDVPVLKLEMNNNYAYVRLYDFTANINSEFKKVASQILQSDAGGIILDLRDNPGGYLERAVDLAGWFLPSDELVVTEDYGGGKTITNKTNGPAKLADYPLVVLINEGSASAAEILAGAFQDHGRAQLVGQKTFGKGSIQQLETIGQGASLKLTIAQWLTPAGHSIEKNGITPDVLAEFTADDFAAGLDPQKDKAVEIIQELIKAKK